MPRGGFDPRAVADDALAAAKNQIQSSISRQSSFIKRPTVLESIYMGRAINKDAERRDGFYVDLFFVRAVDRKWEAIIFLVPEIFVHRSSGGHVQNWNRALPVFFFTSRPLFSRDVTIAFLNINEEAT